jgi:hypothetical protein
MKQLPTNENHSEKLMVVRLFAATLLDRAQAQAPAAFTFLQINQPKKCRAVQKADRRRFVIVHKTVARVKCLSSKASSEACCPTLSPVSFLALLPMLGKHRPQSAVASQCSLLARTT